MKKGIMFLFIREQLITESILVFNSCKFFFSWSVLKDVPNIPAESYGPRQRDSVRQSVFPNLNYTGLYYAILNMIDIVPTMQMKQIGTVLLYIIWEKERERESNTSSYNVVNIYL